MTRIKKPSKLRAWGCRDRTTAGREARSCRTRAQALGDYAPHLGCRDVVQKGADKPELVAA